VHYHIRPVNELRPNPLVPKEGRKCQKVSIASKFMAKITAEEAIRGRWYKFRMMEIPIEEPKKYW
jgi:hypothetical protein